MLCYFCPFHFVFSCILCAATSHLCFLNFRWILTTQKNTLFSIRRENKKKWISLSGDFTFQFQFGRSKREIFFFCTSEIRMKSFFALACSGLITWTSSFRKFFSALPFCFCCCCCCIRFVHMQIEYKTRTKKNHELQFTKRIHAYLNAFGKFKLYLNALDSQRNDMAFLCCCCCWNIVHVPNVKT